MKTSLMLAAIGLTIFSASAAYAQDTAKSDEEEKQNQRDFAGLQLGAGLSLTMDVGNTDRISDAELVNNVVRIKQQDNARARILLESHYFFLPDARLFNVAPGSWGVGPFVAVQPGTDDIIEAAALGVMVGFRRGGTSDSWNIGLGMVVDPNTKVLGDGIVANQPLPLGETAIRYQQKEQLGVVILTSFSF